MKTNPMMGSAARAYGWLKPDIVVGGIDGDLTLEVMAIIGIVNDWKRIFCVFFIWAGMWVDDARHEGNLSEPVGSGGRLAKSCKPFYARHKAPRIEVKIE